MALKSNDMKRQVLTYNEIEGFHRYPGAPAECAYLADKHRHVFVIECAFEVGHNEREIEIITQQGIIEDFISLHWGRPAQFGTMSCESIAQELIEAFPAMCSCTVKEDGYGGASLTR